MFSVGDYVIYGSEGVCKVDDIGVPCIAGLDSGKTYYTLHSVYRSGIIHTPTDTKITMRKVISKSDAEELIGNIGAIKSDLDVPKDAKQANIFYRDLVRSYECINLISVIKYVFIKQKIFAKMKKNLPAVDVKFSKMAEEMLYSEFAFVLGKKPNEIKQDIAKCFEEEAALV